MPKEKKPKQWVRVCNSIVLVVGFQLVLTFSFSIVVLTLTLSDFHTAYVNLEQYTVYL